MSQIISTEIHLQPKTIELYLQANQAIEKRLGRSPSAEFLMTLVVERENPMEIAELYCELVLTEIQL